MYGKLRMSFISLVLFLCSTQCFGQFYSARTNILGLVTGNLNAEFGIVTLAVNERIVLNRKMKRILLVQSHTTAMLNYKDNFGEIFNKVVFVVKHCSDYCCKNKYEVWCNTEDSECYEAENKKYKIYPEEFWSAVLILLLLCCSFYGCSNCLECSDTSFVFDSKVYPLKNDCRNET